MSLSLGTLCLNDAASLKIAHRLTVRRVATIVSDSNRALLADERGKPLAHFDEAETDAEVGSLAVCV